MIKLTNQSLKPVTHREPVASPAGESTATTGMDPGLPTDSNAFERAGVHSNLDLRLNGPARTGDDLVAKMQLADSLVHLAGSGDSLDARIVSSRLMKLPAAVLEKAAKAGILITVCKDSIVDAFPDLETRAAPGRGPGQTMRNMSGIFFNWTDVALKDGGLKSGMLVELVPNQSVTLVPPMGTLDECVTVAWDDVKDVRSRPEVVVATIINKSGNRDVKCSRYGTYDTVLHELAHALSETRALGISSEDVEWDDAYQKSLPMLYKQLQDQQGGYPMPFGDANYFLINSPGMENYGRNELFAEVFCRVVAGDPNVSTMFPEAVEYFERHLGL